jgi:PAS domain S-box-containing protein
MDLDRSASDLALQLSEERFRVVADSLRDHAVVMMDETGRICSWNTGAAEIFGYRADEVVGEHFRMLNVPESRDTDLADRELEEAAREGRADDDGWLQRRSGDRFFANGTTTAMRGRDGRLLGYCKIVRDRTEQRRPEENLRSQRDRLEFAQNVGRIGTFEWDIVNDHELWTEGMHRIYDIPEGTFSGAYRDWLAMIHPDDERRVEKSLSEAIAFRTPATLEFRIRLPDGGNRWIALSAKAVYDDAGLRCA